MLAEINIVNRVGLIFISISPNLWRPLNCTVINDLNTINKNNLSYFQLPRLGSPLLSFLLNFLLAD